jgi:AraC family transcriptional regulator of adaptative response / DNA-3-methyladenine glycosylase II
MRYALLMEHAEDIDYKKIIARRDRRFDGRFYFGVTTTRIYCRPVCPARPKPENIRIFRSTSEAEKSGYRPCLRCRPDAAPGSKFFDGTLRTISRALRIIADSADSGLDVCRLSESLGISDRHLRRLFEEHLGASPVEVMITQRLHFAKQLVQDSSLPISEIAFAAGFQSLRRFNEAFKQRFRKSPSKLRESRIRPADEGLHVKVPVRTPYDWKMVLSYLRRHECFGVEYITDNTYQRFLPQKNGFGMITVTDRSAQGFLELSFVDVALTDVRFALQRIKNLFDTDHNPADLPVRGVLSPAGIRVPGSYDPFETAVSVILGQLVSTQQAKAKLKQLVCEFGRTIGDSDGRDVYEFPSVEILSQAPLERLGLTKSKAAAIRELSRALRENRINFASHAEFSELTAKFLHIKGIGDWTASMLSMRCLGDPDAFPKSDLIIRRAIEQKLVEPDSWSSSRSYLTHCLWRDYGQTLIKTKKEKSV